MEGKPDHRSQPLMRIPKDKTPAEVMTDDGDRQYVLLYISPADRVARLFAETSPFVPVTNGAGTRFVQRKAIACVTTHASRALLDDHIPVEQQVVTVRLRGGGVIKGEMRWTAPLGNRRTQDHLNDSLPFFLVFDGDNVHWVAKAAVISVEEH
jgi:hypothetical protein